MTIYTVSQVMSSWHVNRYDQRTKTMHCMERGLADETDALRCAFLTAEFDRPSKVMLISRGGADQVVAEFEA